MRTMVRTRRPHKDTNLNVLTFGCSVQEKKAFISLKNCNIYFEKLDRTTLRLGFNVEVLDNYLFMGLDSTCGDNAAGSWSGCLCCVS